jgi:predicted nucleic acid-binding protein
VIVVDTNILIYRWLPGPKGFEVDRLLSIDSRWAAPFLWRSELRNFLAGELRAFRLSLSEAENTMRLAAECLLGGEHPVADQLVLSLVAHSKCSAYDCEFVALAHMLNVVLVTEDKALLRNFPEKCRSLKNCSENGLPR